MVKSGMVQQKRDRYYKTGQGQTAEAVVVKVTEGFGFVHPDEAGEDVFIPGRYLMGALPGDRVKISVRQGRGNLKEGEVLRILEEADYHFTGIFRVEDGLPVVYPDAQMKGPVPVGRTETGGAKEGDKVSARIVKRGQRHFDHRAAVTAVFGSSQLAAVCCEAILADNGIEKQFPPQVLEEARQIQEKGISQREIDNRLDLRGEIIFTIDGADTKDIDDAISLTRLENGWGLGVHIADVSHYVRPQSALDAEAFGRGTSVYYANAVIPMLPKELSNGICSLNPQEDRLAFSALMRLDEDGGLVEYDFRKTVIRSRVKGVYSEINQILDGTAEGGDSQKIRWIRADTAPDESVGGSAGPPPVTARQSGFGIHRGQNPDRRGWARAGHCSAAKRGFGRDDRGVHAGGQRGSGFLWPGAGTSVFVPDS